MAAPTGGPAFPNFDTTEEWRNERYEKITYPQGGMTLRDYFAAQALNQSSMLGFRLDALTGVIPPDGEDERAAEAAARAAYMIADAMLLIRQGK
jgi:hypothetical protein